MKVCKVERKKTKVARSLAVLLVLVILLSVVPQKQVMAAGKPSLSLSLSNKKATSKSVTLRIQAKDSAGIVSIQVKKGEIKETSADYWYNSKEVIKSRKYVVESNGTYSVLALNKKGRMTIRQIKVTNIDKAAPKTQVNYTVNNKTAVVTVQATDANGVKKIMWARGSIDRTNISKMTQDITAAKTFTATENGLYTVMTEDGLGNRGFSYVNVVITKALYDLETWKTSNNYIKDESARDYLGNSWMHALRVYNNGDYGEYYLNGSYNYIEGEFAYSDQSDYKEDTDTLRLVIYVDDVIVYATPFINAKTVPVKFNVSINNARFLKIVVERDKESDGGYGILGNTYLYN